MDEKGDIHMENIFYTLSEQIHSYRKIKNELKFIDKINPIMIYKMNLAKKRIKENIYTSIINASISKQLLFDFEIVYISNLDYFKIPSIEVDYHETTRGMSFYYITFQHIYTIDIISDTISIRDAVLQMNYNCGSSITENSQSSKKLCRTIRSCMIDYFTQFLSH